MAISVDKGALRRYVERSIQDLPAVPAVIAKVLELTEQSTSTATDLDRLISSDQAMAAKVLRVVNSAYYGLSGQVGTTAHAIVILGFQQIRNLVLGMVALSLIKGRSSVAMQMQRSFWRHAFGAGAAATELGELKAVTSADREKAFAGALLHDIGKLFLYSTFPDVYNEVVSTATEQGQPVQVTEEAMLGMTHGEVGELLTAAWKFPDFLRLLIRQHHGPFPEGFQPVLALVLAADHYTIEAGYAALHSTSAPLEPAVTRWLDLNPDSEAQLIEHIQKKVAGAEGFFGLL